MAETPTRYGAGPAPSPSAEIRSQAIAKLKRAASLPRTPDGRRPPQVTKPSVPSATHHDQDRGGSSAEGGASTPSPTKATPSNDYGDEELLSPSPGGPLYANATSMQRSASDASSFHIPTPPHMAYASSNTSPFFTAQPSPAGSNPDWAAYQLAQSYLPSISPVPAPPSSFPTNLHANTNNAAGRNTPSPLPTLGELRNLSRSNSAAARANAMNKLVGGGGGAFASTPTRSNNVGTPPPLSSSEEDVTLSLPGSRPSLYRSGTIGVPRMFGIASDAASDSGSADDSTIVSQIPDTQFDVPRPRLQRSFTVSSSNMGEERRSAVGRRMVERLAERRAARQKEEAEVRQLWEERRHTRGSAKIQVDAPSAESTPTRIPQVPASAPTSALAGNPGGSLGARAAVAAGVISGGAVGGAAALLGRELLTVPDRTPSRSTERSDDVFEFQSHLSRNISTRTAKTEGAETSPATRPSPLYEAIASQGNGDYIKGGDVAVRGGEDDCTPLDIPELSMTPTKPHRITNEPAQNSHSVARGQSPAGKMPAATLSNDSRSSYGSRDSRSSDGSEFAQEGGGHYWDQERNVDIDHVQSTNVTPYPSEPHANGDETRHGRESHEGGHVDSGDFSQQSSNSHSGQSLDAYQRQHLRNHSESRQSPVDVRANSQQSWNDPEPRSGRLTPNDTRAHKKSSSVSKMRDMFHSMRRPSGQKVINESTTPPTPTHGDGGYSNGRNSSHSSNGPDVQRRPSDARHVQSQSRPLSPIGNQQEANNMLIHHQLSTASPPVSFLPRANVNDPRAMNSKLSPFPGIAALEQKGREQESRMGYFDTGGSRALSPYGGSNDGSAVRGWSNKDATRLSGASNGQGSSGSDGSHGRGLVEYHSRNQSDDSQRLRNESPHREAPVTNPTGDAWSPTAPAINRNGGSLKQRPEIPSFMMNRRRAPPPPPIEVAESNVVSINDDPPINERFFTTMPPRSRDVLRRMDEMLMMSGNDPNRPDFLDDPPRKLLLSQQVLQVVNVNTVKDRYLFLFNDILVIAKPLITDGTTANLDMKFIVKSIVSLEKLVVTGISEEPTTEAPYHPVVQQFIRDFAEDGIGATFALVDHSSPKIDTKTLASLLFRTPELDKGQLAVLLAKDQGVLRAFMARFGFSQMRIDDALRMFLLAVRLPTDIALAETLLRGFANAYYAANEDYVEYNQALAGDLVLATLELNDMLYSTFGFAFPNHAVSRDTFISSFRNKDAQRLVSSELLQAIYSSVRASKLVQALAPHEVHLSRTVTVTPSRLPSRVYYHEWSDDITITLPRADAHFKIRLLGEGLEFDPPVLDFSYSSEQSFRVRGLELGSKTIHFDRLGTTAPLYASLGNARSINVERTFMRDTFHVAFASPSGTKRKYCFSVADAAARQRWGAMLTRQVWLTTEKKQGAGAPTTKEGRVRRAAEAVSLQVLRDALTSGVDKLSTMERYDRASVSVAYSDSEPISNGTPSLQTGKELVLLCRQNSLLPSVLELLQSGAEPQSAPVIPLRANHIDSLPGPRTGVPGRRHDRL